MELPSFEKSQNIGQFISSLYDLAIGFVGLAVFIQFMRAGIAYFFAAGNAGDTHHAKEMMKNAVLGAILLLSAYLILNVINPDLVNMNVFDLNAIKQKIGPNPLSEMVPVPVTVRVNPDRAKSLLVSKGVNVQLSTGASLEGITEHAINLLANTKSECGCEITVHGVSGASDKGVSVDVTIGHEKNFGNVLYKYAAMDYTNVFGSYEPPDHFSDFKFFTDLDLTLPKQFRAGNTIFTKTARTGNDGTGEWKFSFRETVQ